MNHVTRHRTGVLSGSLTAAIFFFAFLWASSAHADFRICVVGSILTTDSGDSIPNGPNAGDRAARERTARHGGVERGNRAGQRAGLGTASHQLRRRTTHVRKTAWL